ncbi:serine/threonine protein kinase psk1 [Haplosporangium bisporale]|nr:serine/threonine protein kinase psk1 [Haplosporangium bisporale]
MDLFSFDHDDHPNLRERSFSVDSANGLDHQAEVFANLRLDAKKSNGACPIFAPRAVAPSLTSSAHAAGGSTAVLSGFYNCNLNSSNKHLPAFFHEVDREQSMTPESSFIKARSQANATVANEIKHGSTESSDQDSDDSVEYEVKIDQDFDAHAGSAGESRGQSPRPGQSTSTSPSGKSAPKLAKIDTSPRAGPRKPRHKMTPDDFKFLKVIGRGAYGKVYLVRHIATSALYAMKVLKKASIIVHAKDTECTMSERKILEAIRHPFIVKLHYAFQTDHRLYLILEYASERMFSEENTAFYAAQLVLALEHLHSLGIIYRDLKPENIMLNAHGDIVLTDFGLSKVPLASEGRTNTVCGTIEYMAPEVLSERVHYDRSVDWWSLGIVIHDMLTGSPPFVASNRKKTMDAILNKKLNLPYYLSSDAKDLLGKLLKRTPSARLGSGPKGIENIKNHRFFRKINWKLLALRELEPPIVPFLSDPESVENFNSEFTGMPVVESPIFTHGSQIPDVAGDGPAHALVNTPARYKTPTNVDIAAANGTLLKGHDSDHHAGGIPMAKTRSSSPDHHHFQDFSYISTSHMPSHGFLDQEELELELDLDEH